MFATKISAALTRKKDRDIFDVVHLLSFTQPDYEYLSSKFSIDSSESLKAEDILSAHKQAIKDHPVHR